MDMRSITVGNLLDATAQRHPEGEAVVYPDRGLRWSYRQFQQVVNEAARGLMSLGIKKGDHVAIWATNYPEWIVTQFATGKIGAVLVTVNTSYQAAELEYLLKQSDSTTLILIGGFKGTNYLDVVYSVVPELKGCKPGQLQSAQLPRLKNVIYLGETRHPGMYTWGDVMGRSREVSPADLAERQATTAPGDVINIQYTSGTTGFPKGVMLTHTNIIGNADAVVGAQNLTHQDRICIPVPFFHCFGCVMATMGAVTRGATMVPLVAYDAWQVLVAVEKERCTALYGVPTMFIGELDHPDFARFDLSSLRTGIMAGSPCPIEVMKAVVEKMGAREITIAYGQTESSPVITQTRPDDPLELRVATVGRILGGVEAKVVHPETGADVPTGQQGELVTRGYHVMKGYYNMPEATAKAIDKDGWLHTGDLTTVDGAGYFKITGRLKDMIIRGGENIYPREIEEFLYRHPKISDVQVVGLPSRKYGEEVMAFVKLKPGAEAAPEEIQEFCRGQISNHKIPAYIHFVDGYPMTASGKIQKYKLRELGVQLLGRQEDAAIETA